MKRTTYLALPLIILLAVSTALADDPAPEAPEAPDEEPQRPGITRTERGQKIEDIKSDPFTMSEVTIEGDVVKIKVSYSGGREDHDFALYWNGIVARSYPGQTNIVLKHDGNGDNAEALITQTLEFDLTAINKPMVITFRTDHGDSARVQYGKR